MYLVLQKELNERLPECLSFTTVPSLLQMAIYFYVSAL